MTWTYSGDPSGSTRDHVRFLIGDVDTNRQLLSDEEIAFAASLNSDATGAAVICCDALVAKFSKEVDSSTGSISRSGSQLAAHYRALASDLRASAFVLPRFGGFSVSAKEAIDADTDAIQPAFAIGMDDDEGANG